LEGSESPAARRDPREGAQDPGRRAQRHPPAKWGGAAGAGEARGPGARGARAAAGGGGGGSGGDAARLPQGSGGGGGGREGRGALRNLCRCRPALSAEPSAAAGLRGCGASSGARPVSPRVPSICRMQRGLPQGVPAPPRPRVTRRGLGGLGRAGPRGRAGRPPAASAGAMAGPGGAEPAR
jgi:hypothetical protein